MIIFWYIKRDRKAQMFFYFQAGNKKQVEMPWRENNALMDTFREAGTETSGLTV
jgi:hypothetical protein